MRYNVFAATIHGKKYRERGLPCQDCSGTLSFDGVQATALADGHGGKDYFRSDTGARLAVATAFEQIKIFSRDLKANERFTESGIKNFELNIWEAWVAAVKEDWSTRRASVTDETRWQSVSDKYKARFLASDDYAPVAYGTTLICAVSIGSQVLVSQIGDGSCIVLQRDEDFKAPVPPDADSFANVTTSLCDAEAYKRFRHVVLDCDTDSPLAPVALFLSSDGLDDCYPLYQNERWLFKLYGGAILDSLRRNGFDATCRAVREELLPYMTEHGSHDDISWACLVSDDLFQKGRTLDD